MSVTFSIILSVIVIGSSVALDAVVSLCTLSAFMSYTLPIGSFLWYRIKNTESVKYGPWKLGRWGIPINIFALTWCIFFVVILPLPTEMPVTTTNMNWAGPIFLGVLVILTTDWFLRARHHYNGPKVELTIDGMDQTPENIHQVMVVEKE